MSCVPVKHDENSCANVSFCSTVVQDNFTAAITYYHKVSNYN